MTTYTSEIMTSKKVQNNPGPKYIAEGFREDFNFVVEHFKLTSQSLLDLLEIWNSCKLDNLFV